MIIINLVSYAIVFPLILEPCSDKTINGLNFFSIPLTVKDVTIILSIAVISNRLCRLYGLIRIYQMSRQSEWSLMKVKIEDFRKYQSLKQDGGLPVKSSIIMLFHVHFTV